MNDTGKTTIDLDDPLFELLAEWERRHQVGQPATAAEMCRNSPELLPRLDALVRTLKAAAWMQPPSARDQDGEDLLVEVELVPGAEPVPGYRLVRQIAWGGFGMVWEATGPGGFPVALKFVGRIEHSIRLERRALELIKGVRHPHLLALFGAWQSRRWFIVATELADRTLADRLREAGQRGLAGIPGPELLNYLREAAEGLDALHAAGIQHRDVKPANLLLVNGGVKVGDYGLARSEDGDVMQGIAASSALAMTPAYAPPEMHAGQTSTQTDQYSLAVSYCQLRAGRLPFVGTPLELLKGHAESDPDLSMLPAAERPAVRRALAKQPGKRWTSCKAFVDALAVVIRDEPLSRTNRVLQRGRFRSRPMLLVTLLVLGVAVPAILIGRNFRGEKGSPNLPTDGRQLQPLVFRGHTDIVTRVDFAGDRLGVSASNDNTVRVWDLETGKELHCLRGHEDSVTSVAGMRGGTRAASGGGQHDPTVRVWDLNEGREVACMRGHRHVVRCVAFVDEGKRVVSGSFDGTIRLWDVEQKKEVWSLRVRGQLSGLPEEWASQVWSLAVVPGSKQVLAGLRDGSVWTIDLGRGEEVRRFSSHRNYVNAIAVSPDEQTLLTTSGQRVMPGIGPQDDRVRLIRLADGAVLQTHPDLAGFNFGLTFLKDGRRAASVGIDGAVLIWNVKTGEEVLRLRGHGAGIWSVAISPDRRSLLSGGDDRTVRWWPLPH